MISAVSLHAEVDDGAADLDSFVVAGQERCALLHEN